MSDVAEKQPPEQRQREITKDQAKGNTVTCRYYSWKALSDLGENKADDVLEKYGKAANIVKRAENGGYVDIEIDLSAVKKAEIEDHIAKYGYAPGKEPVFNKDGKAQVSQRKVTGKKIEEQAQKIEEAVAARSTVSKVNVDE